MHNLRAALTVVCTAWCLAAGAAAPVPASAQAERRAAASSGHKLDHSGKRKTGKASIYARKFNGRKMANGKRMAPHDDNAASKTLPLGTTARVTNLETGKTAQVTIEDRGPYVPGRIVDLAPGTAQEIGLTPKQGVAPVEVAPIAVPQPDGGLKPGDGARPFRR